MNEVIEMLFENLSCEERKQLQAESKVQFTQIYTKTLEAFNLTPDKAPCSGGFQKCWKEILELWEKCSADASFYLLFSAMHHIAWDRYATKWKNKAIMELLGLIEEAILDNGYAFQIWSLSYEFHDAMEAMKRTTLVGNKYCKSEWVGLYVYAKAYHKICVNGKEPCTSCFIEADFRTFPTATKAKEIILAFEGALHRLLPASVNWTPKQWADEYFIMKEIQQLHGVDYTADYRSFDALVDTFEKLLNGRSYDVSLMMVNQLSVSIVPCIWPRGHQRSVECFLDRICTRIMNQGANPASNGRSKYTKKNLQNSWVAKQYAAGYWPMPQQWKRLIFDVSMGAGC